MNEKLVKICRFCLYEEKCDDANKVLDIFQSDLQEDFPMKIKNYIRLEISPNDKIPPNICLKCVDCIVNFDKFLNSCWKSERVLREIFMLTRRNNSLEQYKIRSNSEPNLYVSNREYAVTYNQMYITNLEYFSESTSEINEKLSNSNSYNDTNNSKIEGIESDDFMENSDSDISSVKESQIGTEANGAQANMAQNNENKDKATEDNVYECTICSKQFQTFFEYQDHQEVHNGQNVFSCTKCDEVFSERQQLVKHDASHRVPCQVCSKMVLPKSLSAHLKKHTDLHRCIECKLSFTSKAILEKHVQARHKAQKGLVCHICGKQSSCQSSLSRHLAYHSSERPYQCKTCNFSAKTRGILQVHISRKHLAKQNSCEDCGKLFKSAITLKQHIQRIHNLKKHICHICQKGFAEKHSLSKHILNKHSKQCIYNCKTCNMEFSTVRLLKEHMQSHRQGCVNCPKCGKQFFYKKYLEKHMVKCGCDPTDENFKDKLYRLKSTISLPSSAVHQQKVMSSGVNEI